MLFTSSETKWDYSEILGSEKVEKHLPEIEKKGTETKHGPNF